MDQTNAFLQLAKNLCISLQEVQGVLITKRDGEVIFAFENSTDPHFNKNECKTTNLIHSKVLPNINLQIAPVLTQMLKNDMGNNFATAVYEADHFRFLNIFVEEWVFVYILSLHSFIDRLNPYIYLTTEKFYRLLGWDPSVDLDIPKLGNLLGPQFLPSSTDGIRHWVFKFTLIGDSGVGKTSLVNRFVEGIFPHDFRPTIGVNVLTHSYSFMENRVKLNIFDIGSQKFFKRVRRMYYHGTNAVFLVFDLNDLASFHSLSSWKAELDEFIDNPYSLILIGNKVDLDRKVGIEAVQTIAKEWNALYVETSALLDQNVEESFVMMTFYLLNQMQNKMDQRAEKSGLREN